MMRWILIAAVLIAAQLFAQDTVRNNSDYRSGSTISELDKRASKPNHIYLGFQGNQLLRQLFGGNGNSGNPFLLTYGFNNKHTGNGLALGLAYSKSKLIDKNLGQNKETRNNDFSVRLGYDKKVSIGKRWHAGGGVDVLLLRSKSITDVVQGLKTINTNSGWGGGPRGTLLFHLNEKIYLGTETSWYFQSSKIKTEISFFGGNPEESEVKENNFQLQVPTAIFLLLRL